MKISVLSALLLAGCVTQQQQVAEVPPMTKCEAVARLLSSQTATPGMVAAAMEAGRNNGCFGPAQPQTLQIR